MLGERLYEETNNDYQKPVYKIKVVKFKEDVTQLEVGMFQKDDRKNFLDELTIFFGILPLNCTIKDIIINKNNGKVEKINRGDWYNDNNYISKLFLDLFTNKLNNIDYKVPGGRFIFTTKHEDVNRLIIYYEL